MPAGDVEIADIAVGNSQRQPNARSIPWAFCGIVSVFSLRCLLSRPHDRAFWAEALCLALGKEEGAMVQDAKSFIADWVSENVNAGPFAAPGGKSRARELAEQCTDDAKVDGISADDLDAAVKDMIGGGDDLVAFMASAIKSATDAEVRRLVEKDD
jgi:hypothetical protein